MNQQNSSISGQLVKSWLDLRSFGMCNPIFFLYICSINSFLRNGLWQSVYFLSISALCTVTAEFIPYSRNNVILPQCTPIAIFLHKYLSALKWTSLYNMSFFDLNVILFTTMACYHPRIGVHERWWQLGQVDGKVHLKGIKNLSGWKCILNTPFCMYVKSKRRIQKKKERRISYLQFESFFSNNNMHPAQKRSYVPFKQRSTCFFIFGNILWICLTCIILK